MSENQMSLLHKCAVISCHNFYTEYGGNVTGTIGFFPWPADGNLAEKWRRECGIGAALDLHNLRVCEAHFKPGEIQNKTLEPGAIPSLNLNVGFDEPKAAITEYGAASFTEIEAVAMENQRLEQYTEQLVKEELRLQETAAKIDEKLGQLDRKIAKVKASLGTVGRRNDSMICKVFTSAQIDVLCRRRRVLWSHNDLARAFTLRHFGNKETYLYLKKTLNFPLPALSAVQKWAASNKI